MRSTTSRGTLRLGDTPSRSIVISNDSNIGTPFATAGPNWEIDWGERTRINREQRLKLAKIMSCKVFPILTEGAIVADLITKGSVPDLSSHCFIPSMYDSFPSCAGYRTVNLVHKIGLLSERICHRWQIRPSSRGGLEISGYESTSKSTQRIKISSSNSGGIREIGFLLTTVVDCIELAMDNPSPSSPVKSKPKSNFK